MSGPVLTAENVVLRYRGMERPAVDGVSLEVRPGVTLGIVGESGSGKSSLARCLIGLERVDDGRILYRGHDISSLGRDGRARLRRNVQMVFQDPFNSLNPRMTVGDVLTEALRVHRLAVSRKEAGVLALALLEQVGLSEPVMGRYPHELSGGQRQRVGIARALSLKPEIIIADEPVSALDVSVQAHILNLLKALSRNSGATLVLIAHDLAVVRYLCDRVLVMNDGVVVEEGEVAQVIDAPRHPYTRDLVAAVPSW